MSSPDSIRLADDFRAFGNDWPAALVEERVRALVPEAAGSLTLHLPRLVRLRGVSGRGLPALPPQYGIKGGGARGLLARLVRGGVQKQPPPRDIDLFRIGHRGTRRDWELAEQYMPEDADQGRGVELVRSLERYLATRDLTVNELGLLDGTLFFSPQCLFDTAAAVLRPTRFISGTLHTPRELKGLTAAKMLRLKVEGESAGEEWQLRDLVEAGIVRPFHVALHLDRILVRGEDAACRYLDECAAHEFLAHPGSAGGSLAEAVAALSQELDDGLAFFKHLSLALRKECGELLETE